jgi:hypothetical protein
MNQKQEFRRVLRDLHHKQDGKFIRLPTRLDCQQAEGLRRAGLAAHIVYIALCAYVEGDTEAVSEAKLSLLSLDPESTQWLPEIITDLRDRVGWSYPSWIQNPNALTFTRCVIELVPDGNLPMLEAAVTSYVRHLNKIMDEEWAVHNLLHFGDPGSSDDEDSDGPEIPEHKYTLSQRTLYALFKTLDLLVDLGSEHQSMWIGEILYYFLRTRCSVFENDKELPGRSRPLAEFLPKVVKMPDAPLSVILATLAVGTGDESLYTLTPGSLYTLSQKAFAMISSGNEIDYTELVKIHYLNHRLLFLPLLYMALDSRAYFSEHTKRSEPDPEVLRLQHDQLLWLWQHASENAVCKALKITREKVDNVWSFSYHNRATCSLCPGAE